MDALVAKALNSTVGSDSFSGLDKLLTKDAVRLLPGDKLFYKYDGGYTSVNGGGSGSNTQWATRSKYIQFDVSGTVEIKIAQSNSLGSSKTITIAIKDGDGNSVYSISKAANDIGDSLTVQINVDKSKKYRLECSYTNSSAGVEINAFDTYATPVFGAVFGKAID